MQTLFYNTRLCLGLLVALSIGIAVTADKLQSTRSTVARTPVVEVIPLG